MRRTLAAVVLLALPCIALPGLAGAEDIPDRRLVLTRDMDFPGADLTPLFDASYDACERACLAQPACKAFTYNSRSRACFPKSALTDRVPYAGAWSAEVIAATEAAKRLARARATDLGFVGAYTLRQARDAAARMGALHPSGQWALDTIRAAAATSRAAGDLPAALRWTGAAVTQSDAGADWTEYARLAVQLAEMGGEDRYEMRNRAVAGAVNGYLRSDGAAQRATALLVLADALAVDGRGRDMIPALRLAEQLDPRADVTAALARARDRYGFRVVESRVENDLADPRICADFSEPLARGVDYTPFVQVPDLTMAVEATGNTLCIAGVDHGQRYEVTFRAGLPAASGEVTQRAVTQTQYVRDRSPTVTFPGRAYVLPRGSDPALPVETVNLTALDLELFAVSDRNVVRAIRDGMFGRAIDQWDSAEFRSGIGQALWTGRAEVAQDLNRAVLTRLPLAEALRDRGLGLYVLTAKVPGADDYDSAPASQWFVLSDLGLSTLTGTDGVHVFIRALSDARPRAGVTVTLLNRANAVLATATSDADGHVLFPPGITRGTGSAAPALVMAADGPPDAAEDTAFLSLTDPAFDLSDRGVAGTEPAPAIDVFLTTDRGAYRVGETLHATILTRDTRAQAITGLPVTAVIKRPDGVEYARQVLTDVAGGYVLAQPIGMVAPRGTWRLEIFADPTAPALAAKTFLVEDFLPEHIDVALTLPEGVLPGTTPAPLTVDARYLFGAPGAGLKYEGDVVLRAARALPGYEGWQFGLQDDRFSPVSDNIPAGVTDDAGRAALRVGFPATGPVDRPLEAEFILRVTEASARPVERRATRVLAPSTPVIGIKPVFDGVVPEGGMADLSVIALGSDLGPVAMPVRWTLHRVETRYQWYQSYGSWNWEPTTRRTAVAQGTTTLGTAPVTVSARVEWGNYELLVEGPGVAASASFYAGWYAPADVSATPDTLDLSLDKPAYKPGDTAVLRIVPRHAGTAMVQVMSNRLIAMQTVAVTEGENIIRLPVTDDWGSGAYVTATVIRGTDTAASRNPTRALGLAHATVDPGPRALAVTLAAPPEAAPRGTLTATVQVGGIAAGDTAHVTVAAVDLGILNLTGFISPDPQRHYFGQRRLGVDMRDIYGRLIDGMNGALGQVRSGGDAGAAARLQSPPPTEDLLAYFTGPVTVDADGRATVTFDLPAFNGTVRLMAVAWSPTGVGQATTDVLVRDPVVVSASLPRFLSPGDTSRLLLEIVHATGPAGRMGLDVTADGVTLGAVPSGVTLDPLGKMALTVPVTAGDAGDHSLRIALTTPDGRQLVKDLRIPVRRLDPELAETRRFTLAAGDTFTLDANVFAGLQDGNAVLTAGPLAQIDAPALLAQLDAYPYGCTEQITSQAMPLLSFAPLADALGLGDAARVRTRVDQAIGRILTRQSANGGFGLWQADDGDLWLDSYVSDFLSRARAAGHAVPDRAFAQAMDNLRNRVNSYPDFDTGGADLAYALMVLAREGAASMGDLRYYADVKSDAFSTPLAAAQLGAALASYGDPLRADALFARAARMLAAQGDDTEQVWRADFGSHLRDAAGVLALAATVGSNAVDRDALVTRIAAAGRAFSTQESAWALQAAQALVTDPGLAGVTFNGTARDLPLLRVTAPQAQTPLAVQNTRATPVDITLTTLGVPDVAPAAGGYGYAITRRYVTPDGQDIADLTALPQGTRMVVVLSVQPVADGGARLMINDPLPAGFEIDTPSLLRSGDLAGLPWLMTSETEMAEFRSERFLVAVDQQGSTPVTVAYLVRAISPGAYHHPAASVEDMYRPQYRAWTDAGTVTITE